MISKKPLFAVCAILYGCGNSSPGHDLATCKITKSEFGSFVEVSSGQFIKGRDPIYPEEEPTLQLNVQGFLIQRHEVTNQQYAEFIHATGYQTDAERAAVSGSPGAGSAVFLQNITTGGRWQLVADATWRTPEGSESNISERMDHPVVHLTAQDAKAYAKWAGGRLPSEIEWEYAASLGLRDSNGPEDGLTANTWQGIFPLVNSGDDGFTATSPIGCFGKDQLGLYDMIGNVWEWTDTPFGIGTSTIKGGSFLCAENYCRRFRPAARQPQETDFSSNHIGFRIVRDLSIER